MLIFTFISILTMPPCRLTAHPHGASPRRAHTIPHFHQNTQRTPRCVASYPLGASPQGPIALLPPPAHPNHPHAVYQPIHQVPLQEGPMQILTFTTTPTTPPRGLPAHPLGASPRRVTPLLTSTSTPNSPHGASQRGAHANLHLHHSPGRLPTHT